ncbi:MAG: hypothetical protein QNJ72_22545 [Pleurocapsa sp. MO_226.B13]|nr:hypothetical protein [Pleurocapsa sp. MO_226.B13]
MQFCLFLGTIALSCCNVRRQLHCEIYLLFGTIGNAIADGISGSSLLALYFVTAVYLIIIKSTD